MTTPPKAKKTPRNQPVRFDESLIQTLPLVMLAPARTSAQPTRKNLQAGLVIAWITATLCAGVGIGRLIIASQEVSILEPPAPVATAEVRVAPLKTDTITLAQPVAEQLAGIAPATAIAQAQAGQPFAVIATSAYQPAADSDALQTGFNHLGRIQGNIGTPAVR